MPWPAGRRTRTHRADPIQRDAPRMFRYQRADQRHERTRCAGVDELPLVPAVLRSVLRPRRRRGSRPTVLRTYNDWHIDEWYGTHPGRMIPLAFPPIWDPQLMADEVRRVAQKGCHAGKIGRASCRERG